MGFIIDDTLRDQYSYVLLLTALHMKSFNQNIVLLNQKDLPTHFTLGTERVFEICSGHTWLHFLDSMGNIFEIRPGYLTFQKYLPSNLDAISRVSA